MKKIAALAAVGVAALAARRYLAMRDALAHVEPELRSPVLPFVTVTHSAKNRRPQDRPAHLPGLLEIAVEKASRSAVGKGTGGGLASASLR